MNEAQQQYAHEIYPHPADDGTVRPLSESVPYLYARALGMRLGDDWFDAPPQARGDRVTVLIYARQIAFMADALAQGMSGDDAWTWVERRASEESGEHVWDRAEHYGIPCDQIKPYLTERQPKP